MDGSALEVAQRLGYDRERRAASGGVAIDFSGGDRHSSANVEGGVGFFDFSQAGRVALGFLPCV